MSAKKSSLVLQFTGRCNRSVWRFCERSSQTSGEQLGCQRVRQLSDRKRTSQGLVPFDDLAYLRITDKRDSNAVFRSPLYPRNAVDMITDETDVIVGIVWIDFYKRDQHFGIRVPEWKQHWLNSFISNTPYDIVGDD